MTFEQFVIAARYRLHDIRDAEGKVITEASEDGITWTSALLQQLCAQGIQEVSRLLIAFKLYNYVNEAALTRRHPVRLTVAGGVEDLPDGFIKILNIQYSTEPDKIYKYVPAEEFFSTRWRSTNNETDEDRRISDYSFTYFYDADENKMVANYVPFALAEINVEAVIRVSISSLFVIGAQSPELPFVDITDILLDAVEKYAAQSEHNLAQYRALTEEMKFKFGELKAMGEDRK